MTAYESSISDIRLIRSPSSKGIHKFYARLNALESVAKTAYGLFQKGPTIELDLPLNLDLQNFDGESIEGTLRSPN
jgi:hypothetical protein